MLYEVKNDEQKISPQDMPILDLDLSKTKRFEASRFLDSPETIAAFLAEAMKANDAQTLMHALGEVAKAKGVNQFAQDAGVNRESLYKTLKGGEKTSFATIQKLMVASGVELTVRPLEKLPGS
ncbi:addiction module antidote protein [Pseudomonas putida]|uniref:addiction module antidote protein n=1 Tax=Pseudomonas putida TaxID=303 RepID=UPI003906C6D7